MSCIFFCIREGRILNVETLDYKFHKWPGTIDVDQASFMDQGKPKTIFLYFLRIFYIVGGDHPKETIGKKRDRHPAHIQFEYKK